MKPKESARPAGKQSAPQETTAFTLPAKQAAVNSLSEKIAQTRARRLERCPTLYRPLLARCYSRRASPREAVKAFCQECCGYDRRAITECTAYACPLWHLRPYQIEEAAP